MLHDVTEGCEWVAAGEGRHTRQLDGTATLVRGGSLYARFDCKKGRTPPEGFEPCQPDPDPKTGHWPGWVLVAGQPQYKWHNRMADAARSLIDGTYELCGPRVNGNPEGLATHMLVPHGGVGVPDLDDRSFDGIRAYLTEHVMEGLVFHHPDGRMAKIRRDDFGLAWPFKPGS